MECLNIILNRILEYWYVEYILVKEENLSMELPLKAQSNPHWGKNRKSKEKWINLVRVNFVL